MDIDELRAIGENSNDQAGGGLLSSMGAMGWILAIGVVAALGGGAVIAKVMTPDTMNPIRANALPKAEDFERTGGSEEFEKVLAGCLRRLNRKSKSRDPMRAMENMMKAMETEVLGKRSEKHGKLVECVSNGRRHLLCRPEFKEGFIEVVEKFMSSGQGARHRLAMAEAMSESTGSEKKKRKLRETMNKLREGHRNVTGFGRIRSLFRDGYLQPGDFGFLMLGPPQWVTQLMGKDFKPKNACAS